MNEHSYYGGRRRRGNREREGERKRGTENIIEVIVI